MTFPRSACSAEINRSAVLAELMHVVRDLADAPNATVQAVEPINQGLLIENSYGFNRAFLDYFSYLDCAATSCGCALVDAEQIVLPDVANGGVFEPEGEAMMLGSGAHCVEELSKPVDGWFQATSDPAV